MIDTEHVYSYKRRRTHCFKVKYYMKMMLHRSSTISSRWDFIKKFCLILIFIGRSYGMCNCLIERMPFFTLLFCLKQATVGLTLASSSNYYRFFSLVSLNCLEVVVMVALPDPFREMVARKLNSQATPQVLDERLKMKKVVLKIARPRGSDARQCCTNVSPPHRVGTVPASRPSSWPKWRGKFPEESDYLVTPNRLGIASLAK